MSPARRRRSQGAARGRLRAAVASAIVSTSLVVAAPAFGQQPWPELRITAPAAPGGGWDQTARALQQALQAEGLVRTVAVENVTGVDAATR